MRTARGHRQQPAAAADGVQGRPPQQHAAAGGVRAPAAARSVWRGAGSRDDGQRGAGASSRNRTGRPAQGVTALTAADPEAMLLLSLAAAMCRTSAAVLRW